MININTLPYPEIILELHQKYYVSQEREDKCYSLHWEKYSKLCNVSIDPKGYILAVGFGFGDLYYKKIWNRAVNALTVASYLKNMPGDKDLTFLMKRSRDILRRFSAYMSYDAFRQLCVLAVIRRYLPFKEGDRFNILNIGDGYGFLTAMIHTLYPHSHITLVDIGSTLLFQALNLQSIFPDAVHVLLPSDKTSEADFLYCRAEDHDSIKGRIFNLIINISSMQEMRPEVINSYFSFIRKTALKNNIFYCSNRELKILPKGERVEYSKYPWHNDDKILLDESPSFYRYYYHYKYPFKIYFEPIRHRVVRMATIE